MTMQASVFALGELAAVLINPLGAALIALELSGRTLAFSQPHIRELVSCQERSGPRA